MEESSYFPAKKRIKVLIRMEMEQFRILYAISFRNGYIVAHTQIICLWESLYSKKIFVSKYECLVSYIGYTINS